MQEPLEQVKALIAQRQIKKAEILIARLLRGMSPTDENYPEIVVLRARVHLLARRPHNALDDLQSIDPDLQNDDLLQLHADAHLARYEQATVGFVQKSDLQKAHEIYSRILQQHAEHPNVGWVAYQLGRLKLIENDVEGAVAYLQQALTSPIPADHTELEALCYERLAYIAHYEQRSSQQALEYVERAIALYPVGEPRSWLIQVYLLRARILRDSDLNAAYTAAMDALKITNNELNKSRSATIEVLFTVAEILAEIPGREEELIVVLKRFVQLDKAPVGVDVTWSRVYEMLGNAYMAQLDYAQAIPAYQESLRFNPDHPWSETLQYRIAVAQYQLGQYAETATFLGNLLQSGVETEMYRIYSLLGNAQFALGAFSEAQNSYKLALQNAPTGIDTSTVRAYYDASTRLAIPL